MLAALILLGLLPIAALPILQEETADEDATAPESDSVDEAGGILASAGDFPSVEDVTSEPDGEIHRVDSEPGETVIADLQSQEPSRTGEIR